jgi:biotin synthase
MSDLFEGFETFGGLSREAILSWLLERDPERLAELWRAADLLRHRAVGDAVHLRGLVEISNHCARRCAYCGLNAGNRGLPRYRMTDDEILACAHRAAAMGFGTIVLQSGEDLGLDRERIAGLVRRVAAETGLAITLSLGERSETDLQAWREAGADRYLLRFETSDAELFAAIHPPTPRGGEDRRALLRIQRELGYEVGSGVMVGVPGQSVASVADDIVLFRDLDLDMIGVGPFIPHPGTPLGDPKARSRPDVWDQIAADAETACKVVALARLVRPDANIPATTALAAADKARGRVLGLQRGANVVMPNLTPAKYRGAYDIYPDKAWAGETADAFAENVVEMLAALGRKAAKGPGGRMRAGNPTAAE